MNCKQININSPEKTILHNLKKKHFEVSELVFIGKLENGYLELFNLKMNKLNYPCEHGEIVFKTKGQFSQNIFYEITLKLAEKTIRESENNPFLLEIEKEEKIGNHLTLNEYCINKIYNRIHNSDPYGNLDSLLQNYKKEMYSNDERFIYELLQNADDIPKDDTVKVVFDIKDNHLHFLHTGKEFDYADVYSITSTGQSTKKTRKKNTGYKGIGFKSVFSEGNVIYIHSGDFLFKFDYNPNHHEDGDNSLWELKPIYLNKEEFNFNVNGFNVEIIIELKKQNDEYFKYLNKIFSKYQFILFLRNTTIVEYSTINNQKKTIEVDKETNNENIEIKKVSVDEIEKAKYLLTKYNKIQIPESTQKEFREDKELPEKMRDLENIEIIIANQIDKENKLKPVKNPILFAYLPTNDTKYDFPFLVNGNFILNSSREFVDTSKSFNHFIFSQIGYYAIKRLEDIKNYNENKIDFSYSIAPKKLKEENKNASSFNEGFEKAIKDVSFVYTVEQELKKCDETIIDDSNLAEYLGIDLFYKLNGDEKKLVDYKFDIGKLKHSDFGIDKFTVNELNEKLTKNSNIVNKWIEDKDNKKILQQINDYFINKKDLKDIFKELKIIKFTTKENSILKSISELQKNDEYHIINKNTEKIKDQFEKLNIYISDANFSELSNFCNIPEIYNLKEFNIIQSAIEDKYFALDENDKKELFDNIKINYPDKISNIKLFCNSSKLEQLDKLLIADDKITESWLKQFQMDKTEYDISKNIIIDYIVQEKNIFSKIIIPNWKIITDYIIKEKINILRFYKSVKKYYDLEITHENKEAINKLTKNNFKSENFIISINNVFKKRDEIYYHEKIRGFKYYPDLNSIINKITTSKIIPAKEILEFLQEEPFKINNNEINLKDLIEKRVENKQLEFNIEITNKDKLILFCFLKAQGLDIEKLKSIKIFSNNKSEIKPLKEHLASNYPEWLNDYKIIRTENPNGILNDFCLKNEEIYSKIIYNNWNNIIYEDGKIRVSENEIVDIYNRVTEFYKIQKGSKTEKLSEKKNCNFIFINIEHGFEMQEGVFYHPKCLIAKEALEKITTVKLPNELVIEHFEVNEEKEESPFVINKNSVLNVKQKLETELHIKETKSLIEFALETGSDLFSKLYIKEKIKKNKNQKETFTYIVKEKLDGQIQYYTTDNEFIKYVNDNFEKGKFYLLPEKIQISPKKDYPSIGIEINLSERIIDHIETDLQIDNYLKFVKTQIRTTEYKEKIQELISKKTTIKINPERVTKNDILFLEIALKIIDNE